uniref:RING-type E3 ubiquitin transferase n=1 Tax=Latimeria chalumnae TaxID=7897 RepID=H3B7V7_LATCH
RNFIHGTCRWGQNCRFSHETTMQKSSQICRHFQKGFCYFGDRCCIQPLLRSRKCRGISSGRRGSEPTILPVVPRGFAGVRRESEPVAPSLMQEEEDKENGAPSGRSEDWALTAEFVPRRFSREQILPHLTPAPVAYISKLVIERYKLCGGFSDCLVEKNCNFLIHSRDLAAYERSKNVTCGICMDRVYEKSHPGERKFGILPNCNHAYCVSCIKKWRKSKDFQSEIIKSCPECRVKSSYFIPHKYWIIDMNQKQKLIENFRARTSKIRCKFFVRGNGRCPFKSECIYLHELPAGRPPGRRRERRRTRPTQVRTKPPVQRTLASKARG